MGRKPSTQLQNLVRTLTPNEQGYIRKVLKNPLARSSGEMFELFDAAVQNRAQEITKAPSQIKRNLYDKILQILRYISADKGQESVVMGLIEESKILTARALIPLAQQRLEMAQIICIENDLFALQAMVLASMAELEGVTRGNFLNTKVVVHEHERRLALRNEYVMAQLQELTKQVLQQLNEYNAEVDFTAVEQQHLSLQIVDTDHPKILLYSLRLLAVTQHAQLQHQELKETNKKLISIFEMHPTLLYDPVALAVLNNMFTVSVHNQNPETAEQALTLLKELKPTTKYSENELWYIRQRAQIVYLLMNHRYQEVLDLEAEILAGITTYPTRGEMVYQMWLFVSSTAFLMTNQNDRGLRQVQTILQTEMVDKAAYLPAKLLEIMFFLNAGEDVTSQYRIRSIERSDKAVLDSRPIARKFLHTLKSIANKSKSMETAIQSMEVTLNSPIVLPAERMLRVSLQMDEYLRKWLPKTT